MILFIRLLWYITMIVIVFFILRQEPKLKGLNNLSRREKGYSVSSAREKLVLQQTWALLIVFMALTVMLVKFST